jgi:hypothetical protein
VAVKWLEAGEAEARGGPEASGAMGEWGEEGARLDHLDVPELDGIRLTSRSASPGSAAGDDDEDDDDSQDEGAEDDHERQLVHARAAGGMYAPHRPATAHVDTRHPEGLPPPIPSRSRATTHQTARANTDKYQLEQVALRRLRFVVEHKEAYPEHLTLIDLITQGWVVAVFALVGCWWRLKDVSLGPCSLPDQSPHLTHTRTTPAATCRPR